MLAFPALQAGTLPLCVRQSAISTVAFYEESHTPRNLMVHSNSETSMDDHLPMDDDGAGVKAASSADFLSLFPVPREFR
jgi:hypothetical protein